MPKEVSKALLDYNRNVILQTLNSFGGDRYAPAVATRAIADNYISLKMKPVLQSIVRGNEELFREKYDFNPFLSEAFGSYGKYQWAIATTAIHLADIDGTKTPDLETATFIIIDNYAQGYYRTPGTKGLPIKQAIPRSDFRKLVRKVLARMSAKNYIDYKEGQEMAYREKIDTINLIPDFWGDILHITPSSWKRNVCTMKASFHGPSLEEMFPLIRDEHFGYDYGFKPKDPQRWWLLAGEAGARIAYKDVTGMLHLQYQKVASKKVEFEGEKRDAFQEVAQAIRLMPFINKEQLTAMLPQKYSIAVQIWNENRELSPIELAGCYVSRELGTQLKWVSKEPLGLEQHNARPVLEQTWSYMKPSNLEQAKEASDIVITALAELSAGKKFKASTPYELKTMDALSAYVVKLSGGEFEVRPGMRDAIGYLSLYAGVL